MNNILQKCWKCHGQKEIEEPVCGHCEESNVHSHCDDTWYKKVKCNACNGTGEYIQDPFLEIKLTLDT
jgi:DnaJ-class molecular chaperone